MDLANINTLREKGLLFLMKWSILNSIMRRSKFSPVHNAKALKEFDNGKSVEQNQSENGVVRLPQGHIDKVVHVHNFF
ncbi:hypothetical protein [Kriegella aquimaris]|uniref:Uncharacterized protein n=1 Tax=Kriegella aquimaris TaxID=192904 RepID=A0A1G9LEY5_9FLAO|nr:hypothetical protein [Kriegella aquimaris]SDL60436.1 hypothetical protein SAMN04488514_10236 [Kriegella aquimaris]